RKWVVGQDAGMLAISGDSTTGALYVYGTVNMPQLVVAGDASQAVALTEWQNDTGTPLAWVDANGKMNGNGSLLTNLNATDATKLLKAGDSMTGALNMAGSKVTGLGAPVSGADAARKIYVDTYTNSTAGTLANYIKRAGDTATGTVNLFAASDVL